MRVLNFGSLNLDYVYNVEHFVQPGETFSALSRAVKAGGRLYVNAELDIGYTQRHNQLLYILYYGVGCILSGPGKLGRLFLHLYTGTFRLLGKLLNIKLI